MVMEGRGCGDGGRGVVMEGWVCGDGGRGVVMEVGCMVMEGTRRMHFKV